MSVRHNMDTMSGTGRGVDGQEAIPAVPGVPPGLIELITDLDIVGLPAIVTIRIGGGRAPGEVRLYVRGTYENLIAYAVEPLDVGRHVLVVTSRGGRAAEVEPTINGG
jgi:hypothetical protein